MFHGDSIMILKVKGHFNFSSYKIDRYSLTRVLMQYKDKCLNLIFNDFNTHPAHFPFSIAGVSTKMQFLKVLPNCMFSLNSQAEMSKEALVKHSR